MHAKAAKEDKWENEWGEKHELEGTNNSRRINAVRHILSRSISGEAKGCIKVILDEGHVGLNESQ